MSRQGTYEIKPPVSQWNTDHLIFIANDETLFWEEDAIRQAREEIAKPNVPPEYEQAVLGDVDKNNKFGDYLVALGEKELDAYALEDYSLAQKICIVVCTPIILLRPWWIWGSIEASLSALKRSGYKTKYRSRFRLLLLGVVAWVVLIMSIDAIYRYSEEN